MELERNQSNDESLEHLFITFAQRIFTNMETWIASEEVPKIIRLQYTFNDGGYEAEFETVHWYGELLQRHLTTSILKMEEANYCAQKHWEARILGQPDNIVLFPYTEDYLGVTPELSTFEQDRCVIIQELLLPILDIAEHDHTFHPT